jgi:DNA-3-methyladenine glycosylase
MTLQELVSGPVVEAARGLLGRRFGTKAGGRLTEVILTEVEAYDGVADPASHAYRGRRVPSNESLYARPGTFYVYRSYGIHWCANVVTAGPGAAVLLRGGLAVSGEESMVLRRGRATRLTDGPGKLTQALGIAGDLDGVDLFAGPVTLSDEIVWSGTIVTTPRIGITRAVERPWRFVLTEASAADPG